MKKMIKKYGLSVNYKKNLDLFNGKIKIILKSMFYFTFFYYMIYIIILKDGLFFIKLSSFYKIFNFKIFKVLINI